MNLLSTDQNAVWRVTEFWHHPGIQERTGRGEKVALARLLRQGTVLSDLERWLKTNVAGQANRQPGLTGIIRFLRQQWHLKPNMPVENPGKVSSEVPDRNQNHAPPCAPDVFSLWDELWKELREEIAPAAHGHPRLAQTLEAHRTHPVRSRTWR